MANRNSEFGKEHERFSPREADMEKINLKVQRVGRAGGIGRYLRQSVALLVALSFALVPVAWADRTALKPGWNMFSAQQDVEVGQQVSLDAERQLPMLNNSRVDNYVDNLGRKLAASAPGEKYPYRFKVVNDSTINAFALPGGPIYIHRGVIEAADNEAQLAGVIAHEASHVALRHGTNQASKAYLAQVPLAILGGMLGSNSTKAVLAQLGAGFVVNSLLLKYSRTAESQADMMGTQILYDAGYDPRAMGQFFEKIQGDQTGRTVEFFSNHPSPDNRMERVSQEVDKLGGPQRGYTSDSREFQDIKRYVLSLPAAPAKGTQQAWQEDPDRNYPNQSGTLQLQIVSASYGANDRFIDVRQRMEARIQNNRLDLQVNNSSMGGDPIGQAKTLQLRYRWDNRDYDVTVRENQRISIPTEQQISDANAGYNSGALRIVSASYGTNNQFKDVLQLLQSRVQNGRLNQLVNNSSMGGDPSRGNSKTLRIQYEWDRRSYNVVAQENQRVLIPSDQQITDRNQGNNSMALRIVSASYGTNSRSNDVRQLMQSRVQNDRLNQLVNSSTMGGDPSRGYAKALRMSYEWDGRVFSVEAQDNQRLLVPTDQQVRDSGGQTGTSTEWPSEQMKAFENSIVRIQYPDNWQPYGQGDAVTIAPRNGLVDDGNGNQALAYGVIVNIYDPHLDNYGQQLQGRDYGQGSGQNSSAHLRLEQATDELVRDFQQSNRNMRVVRRHEDIRINGADACSTYLTNDSPLGGRETNWLVTVQRAEGVVFFVFVAPDRDFQNYERTFQIMLNSVRFR